MALNSLFSGVVPEDISSAYFLHLVFEILMLHCVRALFPCIDHTLLCVCTKFDLPIQSYIWVASPLNVLKTGK